MGTWAVGDRFLRSGSGSAGQASPCPWARTRRSRPGVGRGARAQKPVGRAGGVVAVYARRLPASTDTAGRRCRRVGAQTHGRAAPSMGLVHRGQPSPGQRSRDTAGTGAPLRGRGVWRSQGSAPRGAWRTTVVKVGAPGKASGSPRWSQHGAETMPGASGVPPGQVSRRTGGVAARVCPFEGRGSGRTTAPLGGRRPVPQDAGRVARRAVQVVGPRRTDRGMPAAWRGARGKPRSVTSPAAATSAWAWCHRRRGQAGAPGSAGAVRTRRPGLARRGLPIEPTRAVRPSGRAGQAWPACAPSGWVGHPWSRGRQHPTRSPAPGR